MALVTVECPTCKAVARRILQPEEGARCRECGAEAKRRNPTPSISNKERIEVGHQVKPIERYQDAEAIYKERAHADYRKPK